MLRIACGRHALGRAVRSMAGGGSGRAGVTSIVGAPALSHVDAQGRAAMVDVSAKQASARTAVAESMVRLGPTAFGLLARGEVAKGDVLTVARVAGILAAKRTPELIPLCHPLLLSHAAIEFEMVEARHELRIEASASCAGGTGVEMEAMVAASVAALTVYDMCKAVSKTIEIGGVRLASKTGGKSGAWHRRTGTAAE